MSTTSYTFDIEDTSPLITFTPSPLAPVSDNSGSQRALGWLTQFDNQDLQILGQIGLGTVTSNHITSVDGASFSLNFTGEIPPLIEKLPLMRMYRFA